MSTPAASEPAYAIGGQRWARDAPGFADAIAQAHEHHQRPRCLCQPGGPGIAMYVARVQNCYTVKRMPNTGWQHATTCPSYEPPAEFSGLGPLVGTAIVENPVTGMTTLKLDFPMSKLPSRAVQPPSAITITSSVVAHGHRLGLRALLHYLWDQAELTHWKPGFAGRRTWGTVRKHLLQAAENKFVHGHALLGSLYIPEVFFADRWLEIDFSRFMRWTLFAPRPCQPQRLMLMIAEVKEVQAARFGHRAIIKHLPDLPFRLDDHLYRRMCSRFDRELTQWSTDDSSHLVVITTFSVDNDGSPSIAELSLMLVSAEWLPVEDVYEKQLIKLLVNDGRSFIKALHYDCADHHYNACATLLDCGEVPRTLSISRGTMIGADSTVGQGGDPANIMEAPWTWLPFTGEMSELPRLRTTFPNRGDQSWGETHQAPASPTLSASTLTRYGTDIGKARRSNRPSTQLLQSVATAPPEDGDRS